MIEFVRKRCINENVCDRTSVIKKKGLLQRSVWGEYHGHLKQKILKPEALYTVLIYTIRGTVNLHRSVSEIYNFSNVHLSETESFSSIGILSYL